MCVKLILWYTKFALPQAIEVFTKLFPSDGNLANTIH
jgi:hypothetical protein